MNDKDFDELLDYCDLFNDKRMQIRGDAAKAATGLLHENGFTWAKFLGKTATTNSRDAEPEPRNHRYNGFIPFAGEFDPIYDEARGYQLLMAEKDEKKALYRIMNSDKRFKDLDQSDYDLIKRLRDQARELRDLLIPEVFQLKGGRQCRVVSNRP